MGAGVFLRRGDDRRDHQQHQGLRARDGLLSETDGSQWKQSACLCAEGRAEGFPCAGNAKLFEESQLNFAENIFLPLYAGSCGFAAFFEGSMENTIRNGWFLAGEFVVI